MSKTIYLANAYGFSEQQRPLLDPIVEALEGLGTEVWEPFTRTEQASPTTDSLWAYAVGQRNRDDVLFSDAIFAIINGTPPDEGVMVELGMAIALGKKTFLFRDDFNKSDSAEYPYPLNLMLFTGLPKDTWLDSFYTSVEEIASPEKALAKWLCTCPSICKVQHRRIT